jgi:hypothetical protein
MSEIESTLSRPRFRDLVIYEGPFDQEKVARRLFEWLADIDRPAAEAHAAFIRSLQARKLDRTEIVVQSYDRLYQDLYNYCALEASWGWEAVDPTKAEPAMRLGFWPHQNGYQPSSDGSDQSPRAPESPLGGSSSDEAGAAWPLGGSLEGSRLHEQLVDDARRMVQHLEKAAGGTDDAGFHLTKAGK